MASNLDIIKNLHVMDFYHFYKENNRDPIYGLYRNQQLVIIYHQEDGILGRIYQCAKYLFCCSLEYFGFLTKDTESIRKFSIKIQNELDLKISLLASPLIKKEQEVNELSTKIKEQQAFLDELNQTYSAKNVELTTTNEKLLSLQEETLKAQKLVNQKTTLQTEVESLEEQKSSFLSTIEILHSKLINIENDLTQQDYKTQVESLKKKISELETELKHQDQSWKSHIYGPNGWNLTVKALQKTVDDQKKEIKELEEEIKKSRLSNYADNNIKRYPQHSFKN